MNKNTVVLARSGIMLALIALLQFLGRIIGSVLLPAIGPSIIIGSLVNMTLIISVVFCTVYGAIAIGALTPVIAFAIGQLANPAFMPFVAIGNVILVVLVHLCLVFIKSRQDVSLTIGVIVAAIIKWLYLSFIMVPLIFPLLGIPQQAMETLKISFGVVQLWAALIGGALAIGIVTALKKAGLKEISKSVPERN